MIEAFQMMFVRIIVFLRNFVGESESLAVSFLLILKVLKEVKVKRKVHLCLKIKVECGIINGHGHVYKRFMHH